jgi:hypothetical protein
MKYKLIKQFPGSGEVGSEYNIEDNVPYEPLPEFFVPIEEDDANYKISSFLEDDKGRLTIYSVIRLSDNEEFSIGDNVVWDWTECSRPYIEIISFTLVSGVLYINELYNTDLLELRKYEEPEELPVFTTEDGVSIFDGEIYFRVNKDLKISRPRTCSSNATMYAGKRFSNLEAAQLYVELNTPKYSIQDILDAEFTLGSLLNIEEEEDSENVLLIDMKKLNKF